MVIKRLTRERPPAEQQLAQRSAVVAPAASTYSSSADPILSDGAGRSQAASIGAMQPVAAFVQAKLRVGSSTDPAELEADAVADDVLAVLRRSVETVAGDTPGVGGAAGQVSRIRRVTATVRRLGDPVVGRDGGEIDGAIAAGVRNSSGGSALDSKIKPRLENAFGRSFDDVRIHQDSAIAPQIGARAFTFGSDIHFAPGEYRPSSDAGMRVLGHELTHVVQQSAGAGAMAASRISRTTLSPDGPIVRRVATQVWGKWRSSFDPKKDFKGEAEAREWDAAQLPAVVPVAAQQVVDDGPEVQATYAWNVRPAARNHYNDGWGAKYGIQTDTKLTEMVAHDDETSGGEHELYLGEYKVKNQDSKGCNILYSNEWVGDHCTTTVYHCGPTKGAG